MDGFETTRQIRELPGYLDRSVIALTSDVSENVSEEVDSGLFTDMISKPIDPDMFHKKVMEIANNKVAD